MLITRRGSFDEVRPDRNQAAQASALNATAVVRQRTTKKDIRTNATQKQETQPEASPDLESM